MKILVTGGKGFIGSALCKKLAALNHEVTILDLADGLDIMTYRATETYDAVFHLASPISIEESINDPDKYFDTIVKGTYRMLEMFKDARFINLSSSAAYEPITSPYGIAKKATEIMTTVMNYKKAITFRVYNVFGEGERHRIIYHWAKRMLKNEAVRIFGDGTEKRDYVYIDDVIEALIRYGLYGEQTGVIEVGYAKTIDSNLLFKMMSKFYGYEKRPVYVPARSGDPRLTVSNNNVGGVGFKEGLKRTLVYYRENANAI